MRDAGELGPRPEAQRESPGLAVFPRSRTAPSRPAPSIDLDALVVGAAPEDLPAIIGQLEAAKARAYARLAAPAAVVQTDEAPALPRPRFLRVAEAAKVAGVPERRIYEWAREARWAHRPTRRCLRIEEGAFLRWLERR